MLHTLREMYEDYSENGGTLSWLEYKTINRAYNWEIANEILKGNKVSFGKLGSLKGVRIKRSKRSNKIDWPETNKLRDENNKVTVFVYYTSRWYGRIKWYYNECSVRNRDMYKFKPARGKAGLASRFSKLLKDSIALLRFPLEENISNKKLKKSDSQK